MNAISNDTDPDGKMKILTKLRVKLPHRHITDIMEVKVNDRAEANILPLHTFRSMFPNKLNEDGYLKDDALRGSRTTLQCYDDSKLVNHGTITLRLKHYMKDSFQDHQFFIVETPTRKEIIIGHPASVRLGLIRVLCKNHARTMSITLRLKHYMKDSFQDHQFFIVETPTRKEIIIGHPASVRLGLIRVLCKNHARTMSTIETNITNNLSKVHHIDGKT